MSYASQRDEILGFLLIRFAANPDFDIIETINTLQSNNPYTNAFYHNPGNEYNIGLIVPDTTLLREEAKKYNISHIMYFGYNTDPISILSLVDVRNRFIMKKSVDPINVLRMQ